MRDRLKPFVALVVLSLAALPAAAAEANEIPPAGRPAEPATRPVPTFTNADLETLPGTDNAQLPSLAIVPPGQGSGAFVIIGEAGATGADDAAPAATPVPIDPALAYRSMTEIDEVLADLKLDQEIAAAERRVRDAEVNLEQLARGYRERGTPFASAPLNTNRYFMRGVTAEEDRFQLDRRSAAAEVAAARAELYRLLAVRADSAG